MSEVATTEVRDAPRRAAGVGDGLCQLAGIFSRPLSLQDFKEKVHFIYLLPLYCWNSVNQRLS